MNRCRHSSVLCFFFNDTATTEIYTLSLHDALPIFQPPGGDDRTGGAGRDAGLAAAAVGAGALIYGQGQVRQDLTEKEPRAPLARDEGGVLADPAEPGVAGEGLLERSEERRVGKEWRSRWSPDH